MNRFDKILTQHDSITSIVQTMIGMRTKAVFWLNEDELEEFNHSYQHEISRKTVFPDLNSLVKIFSGDKNKRFYSDGREKVCKNPPLHFLIETKLEKTRDLFIRRNFKGNLAKKHIEYFTVKDFTDKDFLQKFAKLTGLPIKKARKFDDYFEDEEGEFTLQEIIKKKSY